MREASELFSHAIFPANVVRIGDVADFGSR